MTIGSNGRARRRGPVMTDCVPNEHMALTEDPVGT